MVKVRTYKGLGITTELALNSSVGHVEVQLDNGVSWLFCRHDVNPIATEEHTQSKDFETCKDNA